MSTYHLLEAATELELESVVLGSSINVIGSNYQPEPADVRYLPVDEAHPQTPRDPYALGKQTMENLADGFGRAGGPPESIASLRFPWVLYEEELIEMFLETDRSLDGLRNPPEFMADVNEYTTRDVLFSYLHITDAARAVRAALEADVEGHEPFWVVADDTTAAVDSQTLAEKYYPDADIRQPFEGRESLISIEKATTELDWHPEHRWIDLDS
jgi:nucleoside-diphosphate-sugar epimerase